MATIKPIPSLLMRFSAGIRQLRKINSRVDEARIPIFFSFLPKVKPGVSFSTMKALAPRAGRATELVVLVAANALATFCRFVLLRAWIASSARPTTRTGATR